MGCNPTAQRTLAIAPALSPIDPRDQAEGVVVLTGMAANDAERSLVGKLAADIRGVKSVTNNMTVKS